MKIRPRVPLVLPIVIVCLLFFGGIAGPLIRATVTEEQLASNVLLSAIPFIMIFIAILLTYITIIVVVGSVLNNNIPDKIHRRIELVFIAGIVIGVIGMFQPWLLSAYRTGFLILLISTLAYILWSHITPRKDTQEKETVQLPVSEQE